MRKIQKLFLYLFCLTNLMAAELPIESVADEVQIDFVNEEFQAEGGLRTKYDDVQIQANRLKKIKDENVLIAHDKIIFKQKENIVEAEKLELRLDDKFAIMTDGKSYTKISSSGSEDTKIPEGQDRVYYGGERFEARFPDKVVVKNAYFTTCDHIIETNDPKDAHYHLRSKKIVLYPGKRIVSYNTFIYIGKYPVMWFPAYVTSLKYDANATPLFPRYTKDSEEGKSIIWGLDYGEDSSRIINGSLSLKWNEYRRWIIDTWRNKLIIEKDKNWGEVTLEDYQSKDRKSYNNDGTINKGFPKQQKWIYEHHYKKDNNTLELTYTDETTSNYEEIVKATTTNDDDEQKVKKYLRSLDLKTKFTGLGFGMIPNANNFMKSDFLNNYDLEANIEWIDNKEAFNIIADEEEEEAENENAYTLDNNTDRQTTTEIKLSKESSKGTYGFSVYFKDMEDLDPGKTEDDTESFEKKRKYTLNLKKMKIYTEYGESATDVWKDFTATEEKYDQVEEEELKTTLVYSDDTSKNYQIKLGDYKIFKTKWKIGALYKHDETLKELASEEESTYVVKYDDDGNVVSKVNINEDVENIKTQSENDTTTLTLSYEKFKAVATKTEKMTSTIIKKEIDDGYTKEYKDTENSENSLSLQYSNASVVFSQGTYLLDRITKTFDEKDIELEDKRDVYNEDSEYKEIKGSYKNIGVWKLGEIDIANISYKQENFVENDLREKYNYTLTHRKTFYDSVGDPDIIVDLKTDNEFTINKTFYEYSLEDRDPTTEVKPKTVDEVKKERLSAGEADTLEKYTNKFTLALGNTTTTLDTNLNRTFDSYYRNYMDFDWEKKNELSNGIDFKIDNKRSFYVNFKDSEEYDEPEEQEDGNFFKDFLTDKNKTRTYEVADGDNSFKYTQTKTQNIIWDKDEFEKSSYSPSETDSYTLKIDEWTVKYSKTDDFGEKYNVKEEDEAGNPVLDGEGNPVIIPVETSEDNEKTTYNVTYLKGEKVTHKLIGEYINYDNYMEENRDDSYRKFKMSYTLNDDGTKVEDEKEALEKELEAKGITGIEKQLIMIAEEEKIVQKILDEQRKQTLGFDLTGLSTDYSEDTSKTKRLYLNIDFTCDKQELGGGFSPKDIKDSIEKFAGYFEVDYLGDEFRYDYQEERDAPGEPKDLAQHHLRIKRWFGNKINHRWNIETEWYYDKSNENEPGTNGGHEKNLTEYSISIGHEEHCVEWAIEYKQELGDEDDSNGLSMYDTYWSFKFWIRSFPDKRLKVVREKNDGEYELNPEFGL